MRFFILLLFCLFIPQNGWAQPLNDLYAGPRNAEIKRSDTRALSVPHRTDSQLSAWLSEVIPESLTYRATDINRHYADIAPAFTQTGLDSYRTYLQSNAMWQRMLADKATLAAVTTAEPKLLNRGVVNETYKWLYDIPVMISLLPERVETLRKLKPPTATMIIRVQLTRIADKQNNASITDAGPLVKIETWTVTQLTGPQPEKSGANRPASR